MKRFLFGIISLSVSVSVNAEELGDSLNKIVDLDEIIVVSQPKEAYRLRQQPLSSTVFTTEQMQMYQLRDMRDVSLYVPSFTMPNYGSRYTSSIYIRGIGSRINNPAVGMYIDNVPLMTKNAFNQHLYDMERIDVLRGPQGTLYGINTEGGIIRMFTKNPMNYQGTDISLGGGSYGYRRAEVTHYHRPTERFAFSSALFYNGSNGYLKNDNLGKKADGMNEFGGRMRAILAPTDRLTFDLTADFQHTKQDGFAYGLYDEATGKVSNPSTTFMSGYRRDMLNTGLNISYRFNNMLLTSMTGWQWLNDDMIMDQDYLPQDYMSLGQRQVQNSITEELVLRSNNTSKWQWVNGIMANYQWIRTAAPVNFGPDMTGMISNIVKSAMLNSPVISDVDVDVNMHVPELFHTPQFNFGLYHESTYSITPRLRATLGLRLDYSRMKVDYDALAIMDMTVGLTMAMPGRPEQVIPPTTNTMTSHLLSGDDTDFLQLLPKASLNWLVDNSGSTIYASFSKGFRAGGYNIQMFSDILQTEIMSNYTNVQSGDYDVEHTAEDYSNINNTISYKPEETWNYELGAHLNLFDRHLMLDFAAYYTRITNQQLSVMAGDYGYGRMMVNAGKSESKGFELALRGKAFADCLDWSATYGYTNAKFKDYGEYDDNDEYVNTYGGKHVPYVPQHTFSASTDYTFNTSASTLGLMPAVVLGVNVVGQGKTWWDEANTINQNFFAVLNAHLDFRFKPFVLSLWSKNITNTHYNTFMVQSSATREQLSFAQIGAPRMFGVDVRITIK